MVKNDIMKNYQLTNEEYLILDEKYGDLTQFAAWQLYKKNTRNNHTDDQEDIAQELKISMMKAAAYYKRQVYIEKCLELCKQNAKDKMSIYIIDNLINLWSNRTRHGASKQKFGPYQEDMLEKLTNKLVLPKYRPNKSLSLNLNDKSENKRFKIYVSSIIWNSTRFIGKKITKERTIRTGLTSLSEYDYLQSV